MANIKTVWKCSCGMRGTERNTAMSGLREHSAFVHNQAEEKWLEKRRDSLKKYLVEVFDQHVITQLEGPKQKALNGRLGFVGESFLTEENLRQIATERLSNRTERKLLK